MTQGTWQRPQAINLKTSMACATPSVIHWCPTVGQTWLWPIKAWQQDAWGHPVLSGTAVLTANSLSPAGYKVGPPGTRHVSGPPMDIQSDWDLGNLETRPNFVSARIHMNARTNSFPADHYFIMKWIGENYMNACTEVILDKVLYFNDAVTHTTRTHAITVRFCCNSTSLCLD